MNLDWEFFKNNMFGIKTAIGTRVWNVLFRQTANFPRGSSYIHYTPIKEMLIRWKTKTQSAPAYQFGQLLPIPNKSIARLFAKTIMDNPNALGGWPEHQDVPSTLHSLEHDVVRYMALLYKTDPKAVSGYITTGGTEGNIMSSWMGISYLTKRGCGLTSCVLITDLTHYSIKKAANIIRVPSVVVDLEKDTWRMDPDDLLKKIAGLHKKGRRGFLIPLTIGYTQTGTSDGVDVITKVITSFKQSHKDAHFFLWIDAALNGLTIPFTNRLFLPFHSPLIKTIVVDFHKFGGVPYGSGLVLYKKVLQSLIQSSINYLAENDVTLLGSRSGGPIVGTWTAIQYFGKNGFTRFVSSQTRNKDFFVRSLKTIIKNITIIDEKGSVTCGVIFDALPKQKLAGSIEAKYGLLAKPIPYHFSTGISVKRIYKFHFLPHCKRGDVHKLLCDIKKLYGLKVKQKLPR